MRFSRCVLSCTEQSAATDLRVYKFIGKTLAILTETIYNYLTALDGELAALCNLQSAIVGLNTAPGVHMEGQLPQGDVDVKVLCNVCL